MHVLTNDWLAMLPSYALEIDWSIEIALLSGASWLIACFSLASSLVVCVLVCVCECMLLLCYSLHSVFGLLLR